MKKWIAAILIPVMLSQALPWTAFAATGDMITEAELQRALQIAGLRPAAGSGDARALSRWIARIPCGSKRRKAATMKAWCRTPPGTPG